MNPRILLVSLLAPVAVMAANAFTSLHPEEEYSDDAPALSSPGAYAGLIRDAQQKLHEHGFDAGPVNGAPGPKMQAALAQFQLANDIPANGMLDDATRAALGIKQQPVGD